MKARLIKSDNDYRELERVFDKVYYTCKENNTIIDTYILISFEYAIESLIKAGYKLVYIK